MKTKTEYHFTLVFDPENQQWEHLKEFEGIPLQPIAKNGKWGHPETAEEGNTLATLDAKLESVIVSLNSNGVSDNGKA
jgi:hypothetical protein